MKVHRYSPHEITKYFRLSKPRPFHEEEWNLLWLTIDFSKPIPLAGHSENVMVDAWRSVACLTTTGEWHNPHLPPAGRVVADLLRGSPYAFFEWASTSKIARKLPIVNDYDEWVKTMERRLATCQPHPDDGYYTASVDIGAKFM